jgi:tetratricopeptide (TPR) repeat protein
MGALLGRSTVVTRFAFGAALILAAAAFAAPPDTRRPFPGALLIYDVKQVVVVYPAAEGKQDEVHRVSAENRARFLEKVHGIKTKVVRDDRISPEDRRDNLLLLGWENRLLGTETAPRPFQHTSRGTTLFGIAVLDPKLDLVLAHRSPYNPERSLVFWSRIDPERDRFMPLPRVGSSWAFLDDFAIVRQGMCVIDPSWPPVRSPEAEIDRTADLAAAAGREVVRRTAHFDIRFDPAVIGDDEAKAIGEIREKALARAVATLGAPGEGFRIRLVVYKDEAEKKERTGIEDATHSILDRREMHVVRRAARWAPPHEETHLVARATLGPSYLTAFYEGLALSVDGTFRSLDLALQAAILTDRNLLPPLETVLDEERLRALPDEVGFVAAGLLVDWLRATVPPESFRRLYGSTSCAPADIARAIGKSSPEASEAYKAWVSKLGESRARDLQFLKAEDEAKSRQLVGDWAGVAKAFEKALGIRPDDPQTLFNLASAELRSGAYASAESHLARLLRLPLSREQSRFVIFGHYQLGRVYDVRGKRDDALREYRKVLALEDQRDAHRLAREAIAKPVTPDQLD